MPCGFYPDVVLVSEGLDVSLGTWNVATTQPGMKRGQTCLFHQLSLFRAYSYAAGDHELLAVRYSKSGSRFDMQVRKISFFQYSKLYDTRRERFPHLNKSKVAELLL